MNKTERIFKADGSSVGTKEGISRKTIVGGILSAVGMLSVVSLALFLLPNSSISTWQKVLSMSVGFGFIGIGFFLFIKASQQVCAYCSKMFEPGDKVTEVLGRGPGQFFACHTTCYCEAHQEKQSA